jgi:PAS domain S-box-containing protein
MKKATRTSAIAAALRRRAQARLRKQQKGQGRSRTKADIQQLVHELQIHQIELELQNEELNQASLAARTALEKFTDLYDFAPVGYFSLDEQGLILEVNLTGAALLGLERSRLTNRHFQLFVDAASRPNFNAFLARTFGAHGKQVREMRLLKEDRTSFWADLEASSAAAVSGTRRWCRMAVVDIAARKRAEEAQRRVEILAATNQRLEQEIVQRRAAEAALKKSEQRYARLLEESRHTQLQLRALAHQILRVQEDERKQISRELHDEVSQTLVGINVHLALLFRAKSVNPKFLRQKLADTQQLVNQSVQIVHRFARELRPAQLDDLGLIPALRSFMRVFPGCKELRIRFTAFAGVETLENDKRTVLYRVAQEALINVGKHAQASLVNVSILKSGGTVCMEIKDNGKSFSVGQALDPKKNRRLGLISMRERVEMVGGAFNVESASGKGTTIRVQIPF